MPTIEPVGGAPHACRTQRLVAVGLATRHNLVAELSNSVRFVNLGMTARKDGTPVGGWFCLQVQKNKKYNIMAKTIIELVMTAYVLISSMLLVICIAEEDIMGLVLISLPIVMCLITDWVISYVKRLIHK